jgi:hypothetical protein
MYPNAVNKIFIIIIELTVSTGYFVLIPARKVETDVETMFLLWVVPLGKF